MKPYVKRQKNDATDAEAICEAVTRPNMRSVATKTPEQQSPVCQIAQKCIFCSVELCARFLSCSGDPQDLLRHVENWAGGRVATSRRPSSYRQFVQLSKAPDGCRSFSGSSWSNRRTLSVASIPNKYPMSFVDRITYIFVAGIPIVDFGVFRMGLTRIKTRALYSSLIEGGRA